MNIHLIYIKIVIFFSLLLFNNTNSELYAYTPTDTLIKQLSYEKNNVKRVNILNEIGWNYLQVTPDSAKLYFNKALNLAEEINDIKGKTRALTNLSYYYTQACDFFSAGKYLTSARLLAEKNSDEINLARIYGAIASNYNNIRLNSKAREFYIKCLLINKKVNNLYNINSCLIALANSYLMDSNYTKANGYLEEIKPSIGNYLYTPLGFNFYFINAKINFAQNRNDLGFKFMDTTVIIARQTNNTFAIIDCDLFLCQVLINTKQYKKAIIIAKKAEAMSDGIDYYLGKLAAYHSLGSIFNALGDFTKSNYYFAKSLKIKDDLFNESVINNVQIIQSQYEFDLTQTIIRHKEYDNLLKINQETDQKILITVLIFILFIYIILSINLIRAYRKVKFSTLQLKNTFEEISTISKTLEIQNKDLESLNSTKNKFFSIIGHDLRNPIGGIKNLTELLISRADEFSAEQETDIYVSINKAVSSTYILLENLLQWAKAQSGGIVVLPATIHIKPLINRVTDLINHSAQQKGISIELRTIDTTVIGDYNLIETVLRNLISNAIKYTSLGGFIIIIVEVIPNQGIGENFIKISIQDDGVGMSEDKLKSLFTIGKQISTKGTANESGSGLGLLICKEFINLMGGEIKVESEVGKGSVFSFILPSSNQ